jgi:peptide deformylase
MLLKLVQVGEAILRQKARELTRPEIGSERIRQLIQLMRQTLLDAPGVGLAAPQIGESIQLAIVEDLPEYSRNLTTQQIADREREPVPFQVIINPTLTPAGETKAEFFEGCLSVNGFTALVPRYRRVRVECLDENAKPDDRGLRLVRSISTRIDHLNGMLYVDRMYCGTQENYTADGRK